MTVQAFLSHLLFVGALFLISALLTRVMIGVGILDVPNERSSHQAPTPRSGGIAVAATFFVGLVVMYVGSDVVRLPQGPFVAFLVVSGLLAAVSLYDDLKGASAFVKLAAQAASAGLFVLFVAHLDRFELPVAGTVSLGAAGYVVTVFWLIAFTNAFNFMDGINGLASGVAIIAALFLALVGFVEGAHFVYIASLSLTGALLGFFVFNFARGRIFLGDTGSQVVGFVLAALAVLGRSGEAGEIPFWFTPLVFFTFLFDVVLTLAHRGLRGRNVLRAHREHLYQLLVRLGASHVRVSLLHFVLAALNGAVALLLVRSGWAGAMAGLVGLLLIHVCYAVGVYGAAVRAGEFRLFGLSRS